jgi:inorganic pyrophosphatase
LRCSPYRRLSPAKRGLGIEFDVTIEIPKGTRNKYKMDPKTGRIRLDRTLFTATQYPADFGFVEHSLGEDGDPLDALVLVQEPTFPGCLIRCRAIGMFRMWDNARPDPTVLCVPTADPRLAHLADITDLEHFYKLEIQHFFHVYQDLEPGRRIDVEHGIWASRTDAEAEVKQSQDRCRQRPATGPAAARALPGGARQAPVRGSRC